VCGRYSLKTDAEELARQLHLEETPFLEPRYNIGPLQAAPIVTSAAPRRLTIARWGLLPAWARDTRIASKLINARAETLLQKAVFRDLVPAHRCLVPCDGFYEWQRHGQQRTPHYVHPRDPQVMAMAGLWCSSTGADGLDLVTFTIVTTRANEALASLHDRMPVFLDEAGRARWLSGPTADPAAFAELLVPWRGSPLSTYQVGSRVNQVAFDDPACLAPAHEVQLSLW
jgi:putative SOS response-associated peptidase YedK